jgi:septum site-determining protein MinD
LNSRSIEPFLIVNRIDPEMVRRGDMLSLEDVQEILGLELIGVVERDDSIIIAANTGEPVVYNNASKAGAAFGRIAARLCGEAIPLERLGQPSIWGRIGRRLGVAS